MMEEDAIEDDDEVALVAHAQPSIGGHWSQSARHKDAVSAAAPNRQTRGRKQ